MQIKTLIFLLLSLSNILSSPHQQLKLIDQLISSKRNKKQNSQQIHIQKLSAFPIPSNQPARVYQSIRLNTNMKSYPNVVIDRTNIYTIEGELLATFPENSLIASMRNQNVMILTQVDKKIVVKDLVVRNRTAMLEQILNVDNCVSQATAFTTLGGLKAKSSLLIAYSNGSIMKYSEKGEYRNQSDHIPYPILKLTKTSSSIYAQTQTQLFILQLFRPLDEPVCSLTLDSAIINYFSRTDEMFVHIDGKLITFSISKCQLTKYHIVPDNSTVHQLGNKIIVFKGSIVYYLNPENEYSMGVINLKLPPTYSVSSAKKSQFSSLICVYSHQFSEVSIYQYVWQGQEKSFEMKGFKIPVMIIIFGIILFYTYKNKKGKQAQNAIGKEGNQDKQALLESELEGLEKLNPGQLQKMMEQIKEMEKKKK